MSGVLPVVLLVLLSLLGPRKDDIPRGTGQYVVLKVEVGAVSRVARRSHRRDPSGPGNHCSIVQFSTSVGFHV
jgi:hypothetical protein